MEFLKNNKRFSFKLDGENIWKKHYSIKTEEKENELVTEYLFGDDPEKLNLLKNI